MSRAAQQAKEDMKEVIDLSIAYDKVGYPEIWNVLPTHIFTKESRYLNESIQL